MKFTNSFLFTIFFLLFANISFSQKKVQLPTHADGSPFICEKFEMLEKTLPNLQLVNTNITPPFLPNISAALPRTDDEVKVGDSNTAEFEIHAAVNPTDDSNIIVASMKVEGTGAATKLNFAIYYTNDFGETWEKSSFKGEVPNEIVFGGGDPMIVFDQNGRAYFSWLLVTLSTTTGMGTWAMYYATSDNGGDNWTFNLNNTIEKQNFEDFVNLSDLQFAPDKQWMVSDLTLSSPFYGNIYIAYVDIEVATETYNIKVKRKESTSNTFETTPKILTTQNFAIAQFSSIDVAKNGDIYATFFASTGGTNYGIYVTKSTDGGNSFSTEQKISNIAFPQVFSGDIPIAGISDSRLYPCPHVAVDKSDGPNAGNIYVTWTAFGVNTMSTDGADIYLASSSDGGTNWSTPSVINNDPNTNVHQLYSSIEVTRTGIVVLSWYDRREDASNNVNTHYYMGYSTDGGTTFEQFPVSTELSNFEFINTNNLDIGPGEYNQIVTVQDYAIPVWGDGRTNNGDIAIYAAFYNLNILSSDKISTVNSKFSFTGPTPNPVKDIAEFSLHLKASSNVRILLHDLSGKMISEVINGDYLEGEHSIQLTTKDLANGEYFVTAYTDVGFQTKKVIVVR